MGTERIRKRARAERGYMLLFSYAVIIPLVILSATMVTHVLAEVRSSQRAESVMQALYLAEAGIDRAIGELRVNYPSTAAYTASLGSTGNYSVSITSIGNNRCLLSAQGTSGSLQINRTVQAIVLGTPNPLFPFAMFGDQSVVLSGNGNADSYTDSYNSLTGMYQPSNPGTGGDIGTNSTAAGAVTLSGNALVVGNVYVGSNGDPNVVITRQGNNTVVTGTKTSLPKPVPLSPVTVPSELASQGSLSIAGGKIVTYPGGTYLFDSISISGKGQLKFSGPAIVYLTGDLSVSGKGIGTSLNLPGNLSIRVKGNGNVQFTGDAAFYGTVYAPESNAKITGNGAFFGAVSGHQVTDSGNGGIHYDEALRTAGGGFGFGIQLLSWQD